MDFGLEVNRGSVKGFDLIVNCTPIGLVEGTYPADISELDGGQTVFDMVYGWDTPLISAARAKGCRLADGADMLVGQGTASFRMWFGREPDTEIMKGALQ